MDLLEKYSLNTTNILANEKLKINVIYILSYIDTHDFIDFNKKLILNLGMNMTKYKKLNYDNVNLIINNILSNNIDCLERLNCTTKFLNSTTINQNFLSDSCGFGQNIEEHDIEQKVLELVENNDSKKILMIIRNMFPWIKTNVIMDIVSKYAKHTNNNEFNLPFQEMNMQLNNDILQKHLKETGGQIITRFPPEPNGYLHIGHAKAMYINFSFAKSQGGKCYLRFDDTNPSKEKDEYINSILEDVNWLGHECCKITYTSDYFEKLYDYAIELIKRDKAYVCEEDRETMNYNRYNKIESKHRNRPIEESLQLFDDMRSGKYSQNTLTLRMKGDMSSGNPNMRDHVAYRILNESHPRTKNNWKIYPTYDYSHCIVDSVENITHSLCSMEYKTRNESYKWLLNTLEIYRPPQIEYTRLNISHTILSKRKLIEIVKSEIVTGWDDPRMPTIKGLKRRGYTPEAINNFCEKIGINVGGDNSMVKYELLESCARDHLNLIAPRIMAVLNPLKVTIINLNETINVTAKDFPNNKNTTTRIIEFTNYIYIDKSDFMINAPTDYKRLTNNPNIYTRLKYGFPVKYLTHSEDAYGNPIEIIVEYINDNNLKVNGNINWVNVYSIDIKVKIYDHLFPKEYNDNIDMFSQLNLNSVTTLNSKIERFNFKHHDKFQFERLGYFVVDHDSTNENYIFNKIVGLK